ncbi:MAG: DNA-3-methyladenine glycosylase [Gemmatimonadaceae bacterium]
MKPGRIVPASFYARETELVARDMLGMLLQFRTEQGTASGMIVETEAYVGEHDAACHAAAGLTARTAPLYQRAGLAYVYFIYGMYWCFNAVTRPAGQPSAVLVRAVQPVQRIDLMRMRRPQATRDRDLTNGPGKLCMAMGITGTVNCQSLQRGSLVIRDYAAIPDSAVAVTPRIGIRHAADWPLRWFIRGNEFVSKA